MEPTYFASSISHTVNARMSTVAYTRSTGYDGKTVIFCTFNVGDKSTVDILLVAGMLRSLELSESDASSTL
jgi:hypothetical protein